MSQNTQQKPLETVVGFVLRWVSGTSLWQWLALVLIFSLIISLVTLVACALIVAAIISVYMYRQASLGDLLSHGNAFAALFN